MSGSTLFGMYFEDLTTIELAWDEFLANEKPSMKEAIEWLEHNTYLLDAWAHYNEYYKFD